MKKLFKEIVTLLARMDDRVNRMQIHFPKFLRVHEDLDLLGKILVRLARIL